MYFHLHSLSQDDSYGHLAEAIKHSIGEEHEQRIKDELSRLQVPFSDEHLLRSQVSWDWWTPGHVTSIPPLIGAGLRQDAGHQAGRPYRRGRLHRELDREQGAVRGPGGAQRIPAGPALVIPQQVNHIRSSQIHSDPFYRSCFRFGSGMVIYWFGFVSNLDSNRSAGIMLSDSFPTTFVRYKPQRIRNFHSSESNSEQ